jgi:TATA-box binding protein (TBP) (component of TFIID and TFIIIB)
MEIEKIKDGQSGKLVITGLIKSVEDSTLFKEALSEMITTSKSVSIHIKDSFIITSSIIGTMLKVVNVDKVSLTVYVTQEDLYSLLSQLNLLEALNVKKG